MEVFLDLDSTLDCKDAKEASRRFMGQDPEGFILHKLNNVFHDESNSGMCELCVNYVCVIYVYVCIICVCIICVFIICVCIIYVCALYMCVCVYVYIIYVMKILLYPCFLLISKKQIHPHLSYPYTRNTSNQHSQVL